MSSPAAAPASAIDQPLGRNVIWMTAGTFLLGLSGYAFLALVGHGRFDDTSYAALSATYLILSIIGPGVFVAAEQESSRLVSSALARGTATATIVRRLGVLTALLAVVTILVLALAAPTLIPHVLKGNVGLLLALAMSVVGSAAVYLIRGLTGGQHRFRRYAVSLMVDGGVRLFGCLSLVLFGVASPLAYGLTLCAGPLVAALATGFGAAPSAGVPAAGVPAAGVPAAGVPAAGVPAAGVPAAGVPAAGAPPPSTPTAAAPTASSTTAGIQAAGAPTIGGATMIGWRTLGRGLAWLLIASVLAMVLANLSGVLVTGLLPEQPLLAAGFTTALVLTRIPLLAMGAVQALVLPRLSAAAGQGRMVDFRNDLVKGLLLVGGLGVISLTGIAVLGRWIIGVLFGDAADTTGTGVLALLVVSAVMLMAISLLQPALIAIHQHTALVWGWLLGAALYAAAFALPLAALDRAVFAQLIGPAGTLLFHAVTIRRKAQ